MKTGAKVLSVDGVVRGIFIDDLKLIIAVMEITNNIAGDVIQTDKNTAVTKHGEQIVRIEWLAFNVVNNQ